MSDTEKPEDENTVIAKMDLDTMDSEAVSSLIAMMVIQKGETPADAFTMLTIAALKVSACMRKELTVEELIEKFSEAFKTAQAINEKPSGPLN